VEVGRLGTRHDFYVVEHKNRGIWGIFREKCVTLQLETDEADYIYGSRGDAVALGSHHYHYLLRCRGAFMPSALDTLSTRFFETNF